MNLDLSVKDDNGQEIAFRRIYEFEKGQHAYIADTFADLLREVTKKMK